MLKHTGTPQQLAALFGALAAAQGEFLPIERNKTVRVTMKSGGTYTFDYADLDEVLSKTRKALSNNGLCLFQTLGERTEKEIGPEHASNTFGTLTTVLAHREGAYIEDEQTFSLAGSNQDMGGEITYKRRYGASAILNIAAETDDDGGTGDRSKAAGRDLSDRPTRGQRDPIHPTDATVDEVDTILKFKEARTINELTGIFNNLPADVRRPGTNLYAAFQARRGELVPPNKG